MSHKNFCLSSLTQVWYLSMFCFSSCIMNPMLLEYYEITPEKSALFSLLGAVSFLLTTPVAFFLRNHGVSRRIIIFLALLVLGVGMIIRTGNMQWLTEDSHIVMVFAGNFINGSSLALLTTTVIPEMYDNLEQMEDYHEYDQD